MVENKKTATRGGGGWACGQAVSETAEARAIALHRAHSRGG